MIFIPGIDLMKKYMWMLLVVILVILGAFLAFYIYDQPRRTTGEFIGNLYQQRYEDAAGMLHPPSSIVMNGEGSLVIVDKNLRSTTVPEVQLPFMSSGLNGAVEHDFAVTALGPSTNGILHHPPVTIYLNIVGDEVSIEMVEQ